MSDQLNAGATSETTQTWKTIHTIHTPIHSNKANMKGWLWRPNDFWGPCGPKTSWHLFYRWGKSPKKPHPGYLSRPGIEPGPAAWQSRMLLPVPQRWTQLERLPSRALEMRMQNRKCVCVCSNANSLHYYVLRVPRKADTWRWAWSIFRITNHLGGLHYVWEEYLYSVVGSWG